MWPQATSSNPIPEQIGGDGLLLQHQESAVFDGWSAHVRYFLARYPLETRQFVAQRLATYGIRSLLASHRQEDLNLDVLASATDSADKDVLLMMKEHGRVRRAQADRQRASAHAPSTRQVPAHVAAGPTPRAALRERERTDNIAERERFPLSRGEPLTVVGRSDVLTRYPFVDDLSDKRGGGVGAALNRAMPTTPVQNLAKREIRRLAHETFSELKASALGIRLSDLPTALQYLFFGDSASLLTAKGAGPPGVGGGGRQTPARSAKDVHLVMALARESLSPTLALAARDTSTLSSASTHEGPDADWTRDGQNMFINERRWMKLVAHVVRRLWEIDGNPRSGGTGWRGPGDAPFRPPRTAGPAKALHEIQLEQPAWRPVGGKHGDDAVVASRPAARLPGNRSDENVREGFSRSAGSFRRDSTWGSAAGDDDGPASISRAWDKGQGDSGLWTGAGRSLARAPDVIEEIQLFDESGAGEARVRGSWGRGAHHDCRRRNSVAARDIRGGRGRGKEVDGVRRKMAGRGRSGGDGGDKEGTRPAGMWQVTPPPHVAAARRAKQARRGSRKEGPVYLRGVQSKIGAQVGVHRERLRKIANARKSAVMDAVARRRLESLDGAAGDGVGVDSDSGVDGDGRLPNRGHTPGEHALDIADAFLESSLMTRLAGGDWLGSEDGEAVSARSLSGWVPEGLELAQPSRPRDRQAPGSGRANMQSLNGPAKGTRDHAFRSRPSHAGWLGDFGQPHTHTVIETVREDEDDEKEEHGGRSEGMKTGERETMRVDKNGAGGHAAMRGSRDESGEREGSMGSSGLTPLARSVRYESGDGGDCVDDSDVGPVGSKMAVEVSSLGPDGSDASLRRADVVGTGLSRKPGAAYHHPDHPFSGGRSGDRDGGQNAEPRGEDDEEKILDQTGDDSAAAPIFEGLEAYSRLSSENGAVLGEGQPREVAQVSGGGDRDRVGKVASAEETSEESAGWSWWEEDKSAL